MAISRKYWLLPLVLLLSRRASMTGAIIEFYEGNSGIQRISIAAPLSDSSTGVARFQHYYRSELETYVFSNGRHQSNGLNSFMTVDMSLASSNNILGPFLYADEQLLSSQSAVGTYTWVSTFTQVSPPLVQHLVLFSGGNSRDAEVYPSRLYSFDENTDGSLQPAVLQWESNPTDPARFGLLLDLGSIPLNPKFPDGALGSTAGSVDIIIAGYAGISIYSRPPWGDSWLLIRNLPIIGSTSISYVGLDILYAPNGGSYLVLMNRSRWNMVGVAMDAPCLIYDYRADSAFHPFAGDGQTVSVAILDDNTRMIVGVGGQEDIQGQPNLIYEFLWDGFAISCYLTETQRQLIPGAPTTFEPIEFGSPVPTRPSEYALVALSGLTKTRQVVPFRMPGHLKDYILEVNVAQPAYIYCRNREGETFRIIPLPGSEGSVDVFARAGDVLVHDFAVYVVLAMNQDNNLVYSVDTALLLDPSMVTPAPTDSPDTLAPTSPAPSTIAPNTAPPVTPTGSPTSANPTVSPTPLPTTTSLTSEPTTINPTPQPTTAPPTLRPTTVAPTLPPTLDPNLTPTPFPTFVATESPTTRQPSTALPTARITSEPTGAPTLISSGQEPPTLPQKKQAPSAAKCGAEPLSAGYGGVGGQSKACESGGRIRHNRRRIRGR